MSEPNQAVAASNAAVLLAAMSAPSRVTLLAAVLERDSRKADRTIEALAAALDRPLAAVAKDAVRLVESGACALDGRTLSARLDVFGHSAEVLIADLPVSRLLAEEPGLAGYFRYGRLVALPENQKILRRLAGLLVGLLPEDRCLSEPEVNRLLGAVHDDTASLRRILVDFGLVTRGPSRDYRRVA